MTASSTSWWAKRRPVGAAPDSWGGVVRGSSDNLSAGLDAGGGGSAAMGGSAWPWARPLDLRPEIWRRPGRLVGLSHGCMAMEEGGSGGGDEGSHHGWRKGGGAAEGCLVKRGFLRNSREREKNCSEGGIFE
ncbi:hypothetical protein NL676_014332 [Syzygium grande]|nr:hypothetical protein NL676_014332 [Syzygium grande]